MSLSAVWGGLGLFGGLPPDFYGADAMPAGCGSPGLSGPDVWFTIPVPPATMMSFTGTAGDFPWDFAQGYSLDCVSCALAEEVFDVMGLTYSNTTTDPVVLHAFLQAGEVGDGFEARVDMSPL